jgi:hypothetical protein
MIIVTQAAIVSFNQVLHRHYSRRLALNVTHPMGYNFLASRRSGSRLPIITGAKSALAIVAVAPTGANVDKVKAKRSLS